MRPPSQWPLLALMLYLHCKNRSHQIHLAHPPSALPRPSQGSHSYVFIFIMETTWQTELANSMSLPTAPGCSLRPFLDILGYISPAAETQDVQSRALWIFPPSVSPSAFSSSVFFYTALGIELSSPDLLRKQLYLQSSAYHPLTYFLFLF